MKTRWSLRFVKNADEKSIRNKRNVQIAAAVLRFINSTA